MILLLVFGVWYFYEQYRMAESDFMLDGILLFFIAVCGICFYGWSVIKDRQQYALTKRINSYFTTILGFIILLSNLCFQDNRMNSESLIKGFYDGGFNGFMVDFKKNGSYVMANGSGLGQSYFYGVYSIKDSVITLDTSNIDNCIKTTTLLIQKRKYYNQVQVDSAVVSKKNKLYRSSR
ncbi:hypothetical protein [Hymenobacter rubripertinctus]|uniref:hypothetical protein n=1 Tax=Hymenobacter rubripertinctus TaxID=2029981 RepID=UPI0036D21825